MLFVAFDKIFFNISYISEAKLFVNLGIVD